MIHVTIQQLSSYLDQQLADSSADIVRQHVAECSECEARLGMISRMDAALTQALSHDPGEGLFRRLEGAIASALGPDARERAAEILEAAPERTSTPPPVTLRSQVRPRAATPVPGPVVRDVPATAWTPRVARAASAHVPEPRRSRGSSAGTWIAIFSLAVIAGSAGVVVSHTGTVQAWLDSLVGSPNFTVPPPSAPSTDADPVAGPVASADSAAMPDPVSGMVLGSAASTAATEAGIAPGSGRSSSSSPSARVSPTPPGRPAAEDAGNWNADDFAGESAVPRTMRADEVLAPPDPSAASGRAHGGAQRSDPYAHLRPEAQANVREAERVHQQTLFHPTAEQFDVAARRWERALEGMSGPEQATVRGRLADARYRAWEAGPTDQRADAAIAAIRSYLLFAPPGTAREEARARLERLGPR